MIYRILHFLYWVVITMGTYIHMSIDTPFEKNMFISFLCVPTFLVITGLLLNTLTGVKTFLLWPILTIIGVFYGQSIPVTTKEDGITEFSLLSKEESVFYLLRYRLFTYSVLPLSNNNTLEQILKIVSKEKE